ncbi:hypothetical protein F4778DRAFT_645378 [Xylariomycetidae sp. FL2044]|nr:hypothetical protein F4778DRAFT_645378 [Xylariomycetidae sp. FL2044]
MTTALAAQLAQIAADSKATLDIKAQKAAHSKSLIFEPRVAAAQNFQTLYGICREAYEELCQLDPRFVSYNTTIFSEQSQHEDRSQMTTAENAELDKKIESFLRLAGARLRLMPAIRGIEWLIRRFRIHEYNTAILLSTFLPYHTLPVFVTLLSILPSKLPPVFDFLKPYIQSLTPPPRAILVHRATHHPDFLANISEYTLESCRNQQQYPALISFWGCMMTEAVNGMLDKMRSGRRSIQNSNDQDLLHQIGPTLSEALVMNKVPSLQVACYMVVAVFVAKGNLDDAAISALMEQLVAGWTRDSVRPALVCLAMLSQHRSAKQLSGKVTRALLKIQNLPSMLNDIGREHDIGKLANGFCLSLVDRLYKKGDSRGLPTIESLLLSSVLNEQQTSVVFKSLLLAAHKVDDGVDGQGQVRKDLASTIIRLSHTEEPVREVFTQAIINTDVDIDMLEMKLGAQIRHRALVDPSGDVEMNEGEQVTMISEDFDSAAERISRVDISSTGSCFHPRASDVFADLCSLFLSGATESSKLETFDQLPPLQRGQADKTPFYLSFLIRIWCGPYPILARVSALDLARSRVKVVDCQKTDFQALYPFCIAALNDPSKKVRRSAADLVAVLESLQQDTESDSTDRTWGHDHLYEKVDSLEWMSSEHSRKFLRAVLLPTLEECVLNSDYVLDIVQSVLNGNSRSSLDGAQKEKKSHFSHGTRRSILVFLASHTVHTPLLVVKLRLLAALNKVKGVSGTSRTQLLLPLFEWWSSLPAQHASEACSREAVDQTLVDHNITEVVLPNDKNGLEIMLETLQRKDILSRQSLVRSMFSRLQQMWPSMKAEARNMVARYMLELSQRDWSDDRDLISTEAVDFLRNVDLTTDILLFFLESLQPAAKMATEPPPGKRRRTSSSESHRGMGIQATPDIGSTLKQVTFVLQLVEGSDPEKHPELLNALFSALSELQHYRVLVGSELGYLQNLLLRSILAMVPAYKDNKTLRIDSTGGHGDLLVNCIQKSSSPAVQSTALLLVASLANVAPDLVLNSVMPIFTQMGSSILRQSDDYSAHVINQTVKEVVPPLIKSLRKGKISPLAGASELLLSFVTAYEHIPSHRRVGLFVSLVETLGSEEFLFALLAMLVNMYGTTDEVLSFGTEIFNHFAVETQLQSLIKLLDLIGDVFQPRPTLSSVLLGGNDQSERDPQKVGLSELSLLPHLLSSRKLRTQIGQLTRRDDMEASKIRDLYSTLLENLLLLADSLKEFKALHNKCGDVLSKLLNLLSTGEFIKAAETLLDRPDIVLRRKVLRAVEVRIEQESQGDANSRAALLSFLPQLTAIIRVADDVAYKYLAVSCVDKIAEKYGKKDPEAVAAAAATITGDQCLGQDDDRLRIMALLCLASLVDVLQDGIVPILPVAIPKALSYIRESVDAELKQPKLHNAAYAFLTALAQYLPYMVSGSNLGQLLAVSSASAKASLGPDANDARLQCLQFLAKQVEAKSMFLSLEQNWATAADSGFNATREYLDIVGIAIDKHSKADISKNVPALSAIFLSAFDLRRVQREKGNVGEDSIRHMPRIEEVINSVTLKMVYKLNDAAFRPIFSRLMDWTVSLPKKDTSGRNSRLFSVYGFLFTFFDGLKSIVTSYASYIIDSAVTVLNTANLKSAEDRDLWKKVLQTLARCFEHDQDDFWQAPAHFSAVAPALMSQVAQVSASAAVSADATTYLIPTVVELAAAADSQEHQKELNGALLKHMRSEQTAVRLTAVRCEQALVDRLGEEWLAMLPEMLPYISELQDDDDEHVERETHRWIVGIEGVLGESLDAMLQ